LAVVEDEKGHAAFGVDGRIIVAMSSDLRSDVDALELGGNPCFVE
jgi:hypothetical protein